MSDNQKRNKPKMSKWVMKCQIVEGQTRAKPKFVQSLHLGHLNQAKI